MILSNGGLCRVQVEGNDEEKESSGRKMTMIPEWDYVRLHDPARKNSDFYGRFFIRILSCIR